MLKKSTSLGHLKGERETIVKRQHPLRYTDDLDKDIKAISRLQYAPKTRNTTIIHAIKIASAFIRKIDTKKAMAPDTLKEVIKKELGLEGEDLK